MTKDQSFILILQKGLADPSLMNGNDIYVLRSIVGTSLPFSKNCFLMCSYVVCLVTFPKLTKLVLLVWQVEEELLSGNDL